MISMSTITPYQLRAVHRILYPGILDHALAGESLWMALYDDDQRLTDPVECKTRVDQKDNYLRVIAGEEHQAMRIPELPAPKRNWWQRVLYAGIDPPKPVYHSVNVGWSFSRDGAPFHQQKVGLGNGLRPGDSVVAGDFRATADYSANK